MATPPTRLLAIPLCLFWMACAGCSCNGPPAVSNPTSPPAPPPGPRLFAEMTGEVGVDFVHDAGKAGRYFMPEMTPPGVAIFDYDGDGDLDLYLLNSGVLDDRGLPVPDPAVTNRMWRQDSGGRFSDVTTASGLGDAGFGVGVAVGDLNNDGLPDVYVSNYGPDRLFLNTGQGTFADVTAQAGIDNLPWSTSVSLVDFDRDGWLDIFVTNYVDYHADRPCPDSRGRPDFCGPQVFDGMPDKLYRNLGNGEQEEMSRVRFQDVSLASGIARKGGPGLGVVCADFNDDRWPDIYVANDHAANFLWINQQDGSFQDEAIFRGGALSAQGRPQASMGIAIGDVDGNGRIDLLLTHLEGENNALYLGMDKKGFRESSAASGLASPSLGFTGFGTAFLDIEHDGDLDLVVANGRAKRASRNIDHKPDPGVPLFWKSYAEINQVFLNSGKGQFRGYQHPDDPLTSAVEVSRGLAVGDLDNDGDLDVVITNTAGPVRIYRNLAPSAGHWLMVRATLPRRGGRVALGAQVSLTGGGRTWIRLVQSANSYLSASDSRVHFGLGEVEQIEAIVVDWPDGTRERFEGGGVDRVLELKAGTGQQE